MSCGRMLLSLEKLNQEHVSSLITWQLSTHLPYTPVRELRQRQNKEWQGKEDEVKIRHLQRNQTEQGYDNGSFCEGDIPHPNIFSETLSYVDTEYTAHYRMP